MKNTESIFKIRKLLYYSLMIKSESFFFYKNVLINRGFVGQKQQSIQTMATRNLFATISAWKSDIDSARNREIEWETTKLLI